jgi:aminoglycoside phosphotransferase (APT) family kinase protein
VQSIGSEDLDYGQSGDLVTYEILDGKVVVTKRASSDATRLRAQCLKQSNFQSSENVLVPKVVSPWNGKEFSMEYVPSMPLGKYLKTASVSEVTKCSDKIISFIKDLNSKSTMSSTFLNQDAKFHEKIKNMEISLSRSNHRIIQRAAKILEPWSSTFLQLIGPNHGDFSFENILINPRSNEVWLVDFLDSPIESPLLDIGRILIDSEHGWWGSGIYPSASEKIAGQSLGLRIRTECELMGITSSQISFFKMFTALRIIPYTTNPLRLAILLDLINEESKLFKRGAK